MDSEGFELNQEFDAAVLYDALHHFENERAVLRSVFAHLRLAARLFLKEPQAHHPDDPETRAEVAEFGVLERGFTREQLTASLTAASFLPPIVLRQADLMIDEARLAPGYLAAVMASTPVHHLLLAAKPARAPSIAAGRVRSTRRSMSRESRRACGEASCSTSRLPQGTVATRCGCIGRCSTAATCVLG